MTIDSSTIDKSPRPGWFKRLAPVAALAAAIAAVFGLGLDEYLSFEALRQNREVLTAFVGQHALVAVALFITVYAASTALSLPGGAVLSITGGFLFGSVFGTAYIVVGATLGAVGIFLAARTALGESLRANAGPWLKKMEDGFKENALSYLLVLRLVPLFPFFVVNLVPAVLGVPLRTYVLGTVIGIIPGSFVFASVGAGLGSVFDTKADFSPASALTPEVITALIGLSVLSLIPVVYKKVKAARQDG
ncbi:MAG: TVP38/TMEM64 family protein [Hyphomicrobiales bacterium]|nr:TVP38/TMEM64 family protein [Hyphomicrobiales bacterium]